jgi:hypothetical protein
MKISRVLALIVSALLVLLWLAANPHPGVLAAGSSPTLAGCPVFPSDNIWNTPIDTLPLHPFSAQFVTNIGATTGLHADFGSKTWDGGPIGIPFNVVTSSTSRYSVTFTWPDESDAGLYPIPIAPLIEYGSDHHLLVVDKDSCRLYELYNVSLTDDGWFADAGAIFNLNTNALRPDGWTSADAAGLPILPGLVRYEEIAAGEINHAVRFTVNTSKAGRLWPARHDAPSNPSTNSPVMGLRFRLKSSFDISGFPADVQVLLRALKKYGMIVADNGSSWFISGAPNPNWNNDNFHRLGEVIGANFEAVDESSLQMAVNSGLALHPGFLRRVWLPFIRNSR